MLSKLADENSLSKLKKLSTLDLSDSYIMDKNIFKYLAALPALKHLFLSNSLLGMDMDAILKNDSGMFVFFLFWGGENIHASRLL